MGFSEKGVFFALQKIYSFLIDISIDFSCLRVILIIEQIEYTTNHSSNNMQASPCPACQEGG